LIEISSLLRHHTTKTRKREKTVSVIFLAESQIIKGLKATKSAARIALSFSPKIFSERNNVIIIVKRVDMSGTTQNENLTTPKRTKAPAVRMGSRGYREGKELWRCKRKASLAYSLSSGMVFVEREYAKK